MNDNKLYLIENPSEVPTSIDDYKKQNYLLQKIPLLHLGFDGVKLGNWDDDNIKHPYIIAGSIVEFCGDLYEARNDIFFNHIENIEFPIRYIYFWRLNDDVSHINAALSFNGSTFPAYNSNLRGFYENTYNIAYNKYLRIHFKFENGEYRSKRYWDKDDISRIGNGSGGGALKKYTKTFSIPGTFNFAYPMNAESVMFHIMGAGAGGGGIKSSPVGKGTDGGLSQIKIGSKIITTCNGGFGGSDAVVGGIVGSFGQLGGNGGTATGRGTLYNGVKGSNGGRTLNNNPPAGNGMGATSNKSTNATGGNGGNGLYTNSYGRLGAGGGSASCAISEIMRSELGSARNVTIIVGSGGTRSPNTEYHGDYSHATAGENGSVYVEWYE